MKEYITYAELVKIAKSKGIKQTKVSIGIWASQNGYLKKRKQIDKVRHVIYYKP